VNRSRVSAEAEAAQQGADPMQGSVDQYAAFVRNELAKWAKVVAASFISEQHRTFP
jgi:hypothetical protein